MCIGHFVAFDVDSSATALAFFGVGHPRRTIPQKRRREVVSAALLPSTLTQAPLPWPSLVSGVSVGQCWRDTVVKLLVLLCCLRGVLRHRCPRLLWYRVSLSDSAAETMARPPLAAPALRTRHDGPCRFSEASCAESWHRLPLVCGSAPGGASTSVVVALAATLFCASATLWPSMLTQAPLPSPSLVSGIPVGQYRRNTVAKLSVQLCCLRR